MRAAVLRGPKDVVIEERPQPRPGPAEVLVRVHSVGVCGSDTHYYDHGRIGRFVAEDPLVLSHEASGQIVEVGPGVPASRAGERVSVEPGLPDMTCEHCLAGRYNLCPNMRFFATPPIDGAFAEYVVVHEAFAHPVPDAIGDDAAALQVEIADAQKVKGLAPLACKTDRIDPWVLAELPRRDLVPRIWLPSPAVRAERERARWRLHLVRHRVGLKNRIHATLQAFGHPCPVSDLFGISGRRLLDRLEVPEPWAGDMAAAIRLIDTLDAEIDECEKALRKLGADHAYLNLLRTIPGVGWVLGYTIAAEIGDIDRFPSPTKLAGYTGLCPGVYQSGGQDHRGSLSKNGPKYLRWALIEAAVHAAKHPVYRQRYQRTKTRLGKQRGKNGAAGAAR